jgi:hypothetical protein
MSAWWKGLLKGYPMKKQQLARWIGMALLAAGPIAMAVNEPLPRPVTPPPILPGQKPPAKPIPPPTGPEATPPLGQAPEEKWPHPIVAGKDAAVQPYLDDNTFLVGCVDASAMDLKPYQDWFLSGLEAASQDKQAGADARKQFTMAAAQESQWVAKFRKAGGKRLYIVVSLSDMDRHGPFIVVPLDKNADADALIALFPKRHVDANGPVDQNAEAAVKLGNAVVFGERAIRDRLKEMPALKARPGLHEAMGAAGDAPVRIALFASDTLRNELEAILPTLPEALGGGPIKPLSRGSRWISIAAQTPPKASLNVIVQTKDDQTARDLLAIEQKAIHWLDSGVVRLPFDARKLTDLLALQAKGDRLTMELGTAKVQELVAQLVAPALLNGHRQAANVQTMSAERQLALGCIIYANDHKQQWPDSLDQIAEYVGGKESLAKLMVDPKQPGTSPGYIYKKPAGSLAHADMIVILYEAPPPDGKPPERICAGYADGHCEYITQGELKRGLGEKPGL